MNLPPSRRRFLGTLGSAAAGAVLARSAAGMTRAGFGVDAAVATPGIRIGYASITWGGKAEQAIDDISSLGYAGIQLRSDDIKQFQPAALRDELHRKNLEFVALSSGNVHIDPSSHDSDIAAHTSHATYMREAGGHYLQVLDQEPGRSDFSAADYKYFGSVLTDLGKRTSDVGIPLVYHNHLNSVSEHPEGLARVFDAVDPKYVKLLFDIAHYQAGGGDPVKGIAQYTDHIALLHIKDLGKPFDLPANNPRRLEDFVELGRGNVNIPGVFEALRQIKFRGWAIVELDSENDKSRTPKESAGISKKYLKQKLGIDIQG
ncbi:MAG TPA: sugar phosphate isomerase/epimerase [Candidatus Acidoferrales bacterium]|nr:sugar phosphate isomerase/epimerase [Candidatus Acidoferrales bacterium]